MKKTILIPLFLLLNVLLESVVFFRINLWGIRPDSIIAFATVITIVSGTYAGTAYAIAAGLLLDVLFSAHFGQMALIYMLSTVGAGLFYRRYYADNNLFPGIVAGALYVIKEMLVVLSLLVLQIPFSFFNTFWRYLIPSAVLTAVLAIPVNIIYRRLQDKQLHVLRYR